MRDLIGDDEIIGGDRAAKAADDKRAEAEDQLQTAYGQCWIFIYFFMKTDARRKALCAYLKAIKTRKQPDSRLEDAQKHLGDLDRLDDDLRKFAARAARG